MTDQIQDGIKARIIRPFLNEAIRARGLNVRNFGAIGDGATDDRAAIQAAFDAAKPSYSLATDIFGNAVDDYVRPVYFPPGNYYCSSKIIAWSKVPIVGDGLGSIITLASGSDDDVLFELTGIDSSPYYVTPYVENIRVQTSKAGDVSAFKPASTTTIISQSNFRGIRVNKFKRGIDMFPAYAQSVVVSDIISEGPTEQIVRMTGNVNIIERIERGPPYVTPPANGIPWVIITPHDGNGGAAEGGAIGGETTPGFNVVRNILPQQPHSESNTVIKFERNDNPYLAFGWEEVGDRLRCVDFVECQSPVLEAINFNAPVADKIRVEDSALLVRSIAYTGSDNGVSTWREMFKIVGASSVHVEQLDDGYGDATIKVNESSFSIDRVVRQSRIDSPATGRVPFGRFPQSRPSGNLFVNGAFSAGVHGWDFGAGLTPSIISSPTGTGASALSLTGNVAGLQWVRQRFTISASMVGQPITVSFTGEQTGGSSGKLYCYASGCGILLAENNGGQIEPEYGVQTVAITVVPQSSGTLDLGAVISSPATGEAYVIDELCAQFGMEHAPSSMVQGGLALQASGSSGAVTAGPVILAGTGSPEGVVTATTGSLWLRTDGGAGTSCYIKESGTGNTGWVAK